MKTNQFIKKHPVSTLLIGAVAIFAIIWFTPVRQILPFSLFNINLFGTQTNYDFGGLVIAIIICVALWILSAPPRRQ